MAEMPSSPRPSAAQGSPAAPRQEGHDTTGQHDHTQETGKESRDQAQALMTQGKEVAAEYYEEGRNSSSRGNSTWRTRYGRNRSNQCS